MDLVTFITQPLHFSKCKGELTLKAFGLKLDAGLYKKLNKEVKDFNKPSNIHNKETHIY